MSGIKNDLNAKEIIIEAVITRADGTVENLGVVSYYNRNPLKMLWYNFKKKFIVKK